MKRFRKAARRRILAIVAGMAAAGLLAGCGPAAPQPAPPATSAPVTTTPAAAAETTTPAPGTAQAAPPSSDAPVTPAERRAALGPEAQMELDQQLIRAAKANDPVRVQELIDAGADVNAKDSIQDSAFLYAGAEGFNEVLQLTLAAGADVRATNRYGGTALIPASEHGHVETVRILISAGVPVDHVNNLGWTAMQEAILLNNGGANQQEVVRQLLAAGANPDIRDPQGRTALDNAERLGFAEIAALIRGR